MPGHSGLSGRKYNDPNIIHMGTVGANIQILFYWADSTWAHSAQWAQIFNGVTVVP